MNAGDSLLDLPRALFNEGSIERLGWTLVHFLWEGAAVVALLAVTLLLMRRRSSHARHAASLVALLLMAALPVVTFLLLPASQPAPAVAPVAATFKVAGLPASVDIVPSTEQPATSAAAAANPQPAPRLKDRLQPLLPWLVCTWLLGVAVLSVWHFAGWLRVQRLMRVDTRPLDALWQRRFAALCEKLRVTGPVRLLESALAEVPTVAGWLRPVILVPAAALSGLPAHELEAILAHELAHIRRHDYLINVAQAVIETLLFYHPAVWWVSAQVRREREDCCDDAAAQTCGGAILYARALASLEELRANSNPPPPALAATGSPLLRRVRRLLGAPSAVHAPRTWSLAAVVIVASLACVAAIAKLQPPPPVSPVSASIPDERKQARVRERDRLEAELARLGKTLLPNHRTMVLLQEKLRVVEREIGGNAPAARAAPPREVAAKKPSVLLVTPDSFFLTKAVHAIGVDATVMEPDEVPDKLEPKYDVIIYDRVLPQRYPANGKFICIGPVIPRGLALKEVRKNPPNELEPNDRPLRAESITLTKWDREHAILRGLELNKVFVQSMSRIAAGPGSEVLAEAGADPATPAIVLHREEGRTFLVLPFNVIDTNWPLRVSFPIFLRQAVDYLATGDAKR